MALSVPLPIRFSRKPTPLVLMRAPTTPASAASRCWMLPARCNDSASLTASEPVRLVWPTMFMQAFAALASLAIWRSHIA